MGCMGWLGLARAVGCVCLGWAVGAVGYAVAGLWVWWLYGLGVWAGWLCGGRGRGRAGLWAGWLARAGGRARLGRG